MSVDRNEHISDPELLNNFYHDHNNEWLGILLQRYTLLLLGVCMKYLKNEEEAKDSVQQIFLKAITELHKYKVDYFKSWVYMVAKNHCLMKLRDRPGKYTLDISEMLATTISADLTVDKQLQIDRDRTLEVMGNSLNELSEEQKRCITSFYLEKKSYQEIADQTGYPVIKVKSYIQNGKRNLRILIDKKLKQL